MRYAVDCDLRRVHCVDEAGRVICSNSKTIQPILDSGLAISDTILFEIASPLDYTDSKAIAHNKRRWTIWNVAQAVHLAHLTPCTVLVSPSHTWTRGHDAKLRQAAAGATASTHDLREAQAMLWYAQHRPQDWKPLEDYLLSV